jgi:hypothetical protein
VLALVAVVVTVPGLVRSGGGETPAGQADRPVLPERFAGLSGRTVSYLESPPGPAIALYHQGSRQPAGRDNSQQLLVGADGHTYRQLEWTTAERGAPEQPWNGVREALLSPDGSLLAMPERHGLGHISVVDLDTGATERYEEASGVPMAWSPDGRWLAGELSGPVIDLDRPVVWLLDLTTGTVTHVAVHNAVGRVPQAVAFAPDGRELAVYAALTGDGDELPTGGVLSIFDLAGELRREIPLSDRQAMAPGGTAWSPDGRLLVVIEASGDPSTSGLAFLDATGEEGQVPAPFQAEREAIVLLGWRSPDTVLVGWDDGSSRGTNVIVEVPVGGDSARVVTEFSMDEHGWVTGLQLAPGLVAEADVRDPGPPSRGPSVNRSLPAIAALVAALLIAGMVIVGFRRRASARARRPSDLEARAVPGQPGDGP